MRPTPEQLRELLRLVKTTEPNEIDCAEFLARVGAYLEDREPGSELLPELRRVLQHAGVCAECGEELQALVDLYSPG